MERLPYYFRVLALACILVAALGFCIVFIVGYRPPSIGRVATIVTLTIAAIVLYLVARRVDRQHKG